MRIDPTLSTAEIQELYGLSRTTAWRARKRGWAIGAAYHQRQATPAAAAPGISMEHWQDVYRYIRYRLPNAPLCDCEDIASNTILLALNRGGNAGRKNEANIGSYGTFAVLLIRKTRPAKHI